MQRLSFYHVLDALLCIQSLNQCLKYTQGDLQYTLPQIKQSRKTYKVTFYLLSISAIYCSIKCNALKSFVYYNRSKPVYDGNQANCRRIENGTHEGERSKPGPSQVYSGPRCLIVNNPGRGDVPGSAALYSGSEAR